MLDILRQKHPEARVPPAELFDDYEIDDPEGVGVFCFEENVAAQVANMNGAAGPDGVDVCYGVLSEQLRDELASWVVLLSNGSPEYAKYRAANSALMMAADKQPEVRPVKCVISGFG